MEWLPLTSAVQLNEILKESERMPVAVFKHSTRCIVSITAKRSLESDWMEDAPVKAYYLDLLNHRDVSSKIEQLSGVRHESPQLLVFNKGKVVYHASHSDIDYREMLSHLN